MKKILLQYYLRCSAIEEYIVSMSCLVGVGVLSRNIPFLQDKSDVRLFLLNSICVDLDTPETRVRSGCYGDKF